MILRIPLAKADAEASPEADALYLRLDDSKIIESEEVSPGVVLDFNEDNQVVGIEVLNLSHRSPQLNFQELQYQTA